MYLMRKLLVLFGVIALVYGCSKDKGYKYSIVGDWDFYKDVYVLDDTTHFWMQFTGWTWSWKDTNFAVSFRPGGGYQRIDEKTIIETSHMYGPVDTQWNIDVLNDKEMVMTTTTPGRIWVQRSGDVRVTKQTVYLRRN